jgi:hypothetical protein
MAPDSLEVVRASWWWRQYKPLKCRSVLTRLHGSIFKKAVIFILAAVRIWNLAHHSSLNVVWWNYIINSFILVIILSSKIKKWVNTYGPMHVCAFFNKLKKKGYPDTQDLIWEGTWAILLSEGLFSRTEVRDVTVLKLLHLISATVIKFQESKNWKGRLWDKEERCLTECNRELN